MGKCSIAHLHSPLYSESGPCSLSPSSRTCSWLQSYTLHLLNKMYGLLETTSFSAVSGREQRQYMRLRARAQHERMFDEIAIVYQKFDTNIAARHNSHDPALHRAAADSAAHRRLVRQLRLRLERFFRSIFWSIVERVASCRMLGQ